jgi:hypothetical protein
MPNETSQPYYVPLYPNYSLPRNEENSKLASCEPNSGRLAETSTGDPVSDFVADRLRIIEATIRQVVDEIAERERLHGEVVEAIDKDELMQKERLFQAAPHGTAVFTVGDPRRRAAIESELAALQKERRREEVANWSDIGSLRKELRELLAEYRQEARRRRIIQQ